MTASPPDRDALAAALRAKPVHNMHQVSNGRIRDEVRITPEERDAVVALLAGHQRQTPDGWMPISEAPKDGTEILVWNGRRRHVALFDRVESAWVSSFKTTTRRILVEPTHFRALPPPPTTSTTEAGDADA